MSEFQEKSNIRMRIVREIEVPRLKYFRGRINHNMPLLLGGTDEEGKVIDVRRTPMTSAQLLDERVNGANVHDRDLLRDNYTDVAFAEIVDPDGSGEIKYALYSQPLVRELFDSFNPKSKISRNGLVITQDQYHEIPKEDCFIVSPDVANDLRENGYRHPDIRKEVWIYSAEGNKGLVDGSLELVQQRISGDISNRMGISPSSYPGLRYWCVGGFGGGYGSVADDWNDLGYGDGCLVGVVAPKAQSAVTEQREK